MLLLNIQAFCASEEGTCCTSCCGPNVLTAHTEPNPDPQESAGIPHFTSESFNQICSSPDTWINSFASAHQTHHREARAGQNEGTASSSCRLGLIHGSAAQAEHSTPGIPTKPPSLGLCQGTEYHCCSLHSSMRN